MSKEFQQQSWNELIEDDCRHLIRLAVREDLDQDYDWTTVALVDEASRGRAAIVAREPGVAAGLAAIPLMIQELECELSWSPDVTDGTQLQAGAVLGELSGSARDLLTTERLILNLVGHLSGIATLTAQYVGAIRGTKAKVYDTRKTHLAYRRLEKYAVRCGGGQNHRSGLFEAIMIKDNHLAFRLNEKRQTPAEAVQTTREFLKKTLPDRADAMIVEIEVDTIDQLRNVLPTSPDIVLLDNMTRDQLIEARELRDEVQANVQLEASGGVTLASIGEIAKTGVDRISVGALTHSARCLDVGLDWERRTE